MILPKIELEAWEQSKITLNLYLQVVGKVQLALMPRKNHWWNVTLLVNSKGLITHTMPANDFNFEIQFNFLDHTLEVTTSNGQYETFALRDGLSVADFYKEIFAILDKLDIHIKIIAHPYDMTDKGNPITAPFEQLTQYRSYNSEYVHRFWQILAWTSEIFNEFSGRFYGKTSPPQLFWHHLDIAMTRFCGKRGPQLSHDSTIANRDAYSHELISFGFWAGDEKVREAAYYSYTYPSPNDLNKEKLEPISAKWVDSNGSPEALLMYDDLLDEKDPHKALLDFLESSYRAGAKLRGWDIEGNKCPPISQI